MDYTITQKNFTMHIEEEKNRIKNDIIDQFIAIRKEKGLSQENAANRCGIARTNLIRIEKKNNVPTIEMLTKLAEALDMQLEIKFIEKKSK